MILLAQKDKIVTFSLKNPPQLQQLPITGLQNVIAVEYDFANDCVFYADIVTDVIAVSEGCEEFRDSDGLWYNVI